jgi:hypothetical protein
MRSASATLSATVEAPVSTRNCTGRPLMLPEPMKWPPPSAGSEIRPLLACPRSPRLAGDSPRRRATRLPPTSTTAESAADRHQLHALRAFADRHAARRAAIDHQQAREPSMPCSATDWAQAPLARAAKSPTAHSVAEVVETQRHVGHVLADQAMAACRSSRLAPVTRTFALDGGLHLELAVLDQAFADLLGQSRSRCRCAP